MFRGQRNYLCGNSSDYTGNSTLLNLYLWMYRQRMGLLDQTEFWPAGQRRLFGHY
jgi:hypothetical protein